MLVLGWAGSIVFRLVAGERIMVEGKSCSPLGRQGSREGEGRVQGREKGDGERGYREGAGTRYLLKMQFQ